MNDYYDQELDRLYRKLAGIYRRGTLTQAEHIEIKGLWARIERLEKTQVQVKVKEAKRIAHELKEHAHGN